MDKKIEKTFKIYSALDEDINSPYIRISLPEEFSHEIVKIINEKKKKRIYSQLLTVDPNFIDKYNRSDKTINIPKGDEVIVADSWYRDKLGIKKNISYGLVIKKPLNFSIINRIRASKFHPDSNIRLAVDMSIISICLGAIGFIIGILSLIIAY